MLSAFHNVSGDMKQPPNVCPRLDVVGPLIQACAEPKEQQLDHSIPANDVDSITPGTEHKQETNDNNVARPSSRNDASAPRRRVIGFEMPSAGLLAATAKLTEAQAELRCKIPKKKSWRKIPNYLWDLPHLLLLPKLHQQMKQSDLKRYWKLSLLVCPDKCSHPYAHQAFVKLNKSLKELYILYVETPHSNYL